MKKNIIYIILGFISVAAIVFVLWRFITIPSFADIVWINEKASDTENIYFGSDGEFAYWCDCGDPIDGSDAVEYYTYNAFTKEIKLIWYDVDDKKRVDIYKVIEANDDVLVLKIGRKRKEFTLKK